MAVGTVLPGTGFQIFVGTVTPPTTPLGGNASFDYPSDKPSTRRDYYLPSASVQTVGVPAGTFTLTCDMATADSGQILLGAAWVSAVLIYVMLKQDATNGETLPSKVTNRSFSGGDVNNPTTVTFTCAQQASAITVGGGLFT